MFINKECVNRLAIYFIYDRDGLVDDYILYMLEDLKKNVTDLCIVCNGTLQKESKKKLAEYTDFLIERSNEGFDVWAYKEAMEKITWEKLAEYDELVLMNYTIMGPVYPLQEMFDAMSEKDLDFWGVTKFHATDFDPFGTMTEGYIPEHIQSHFIVVRSSMLESEAFFKYWNEMPMIRSYQQSVGWHEARFTKYFADLSYKWAVYVDSDDLEGFTYHPVIGAATRIIKEKRCPFFKRRSFMQEYSVVMSESCGEEAYNLYQYLDKETDYDMNLFWDNILRLENQADLKKNLQLNYFLPSDQSDLDDEVIKNKKIALFMHMYFIDLIDECHHYAKSMPETADIYITTNTPEKKAAIAAKFSDIPCNKLDIRVTPNCGRDVGPFLVEAQDVIMEYDYICHAHDKKVGQLKPGSIGAAFSYRCFESVLKSKDYVKNVIRTFEKEERLGLLTPPPPNHGPYYITLGLEWGLNFQVTKELAKDLELNVAMSDKKEPISPLGSVFWVRPKALKPLFKKRWTYDDFPKEPVADDGTVLHAIERIYSFVVQDQGFYPAWGMADTGAAMEVTSLNYMLREINNVIFYKGNGAGSHNQVVLDLAANLNELKVYRGVCDLLGRPVNNCGKLYIKIAECDFTEEHMLLDINEDRTEQYTYVFDKTDQFGQVTGLRFDPSDQSGIVLQTCEIAATLASGETKKYGIGQFEHNGVELNGKILFLSEDPQIHIPVGTDDITEISVKTNIIYQISEQDKNELNQLVSRGKKVSKLPFFGKK